jgi:hypothetical protein
VSEEEIRARLEAAALLYEEAATEFDAAAEHCRVAAEHFRSREIPRAAAHAWAARGHLLEAGGKLDDQAREHRLRARPVA